VAEFREDALTHGEAALSDVRLHYVELGEGPLVVLLHGFPEFWYSWRYQFGPLAEAGFRVVAPDMRGYNLSEKPRGVAAYRTANLTRDVAELIEHLGESSAVVGGHDWGAAVAWLFAQEYPQLLRKLVIMNVPHPLALRRGFWRRGQFLRSWYILLFQIPWLPEAISRLTQFWFFRRAFRRDPVRATAFSEDDVARYLEAWRRPGALRSAIHYYRAAVRDLLVGRSPRPAVIEQPVLVLWGERDAYLGPHLAEPPAEWVPNCTLHRIPDASHWLQVDCPDVVNRQLLEFLGG